MIRGILKWLGRRHQKRLGVETPYFTELVEEAPGSIVPILGFMWAARSGSHLPVTVLHMVRLGATLSRDCGTCLEIGVRHALGDGVPRGVIDAALRGPGEALEADLEVALRFGERLGGGLDVEEERERLRARFGTRGVIDASIAVAGALTFPAVQRGMGYGVSCEVGRAPLASGP